VFFYQKSSKSSVSRLKNPPTDEQESRKQIIGKKFNKCPVFQTISVPYNMQNLSFKNVPKNSIFSAKLIQPAVKIRSHNDNSELIESHI
jgi:hypothetical protein